MERTDLEMLFGYNRWANAKVLAACRELSAEQLHAPAQCSFGSLMGTLAHIYGAERVWRLRLSQGGAPVPLATAAGFPTLPVLEQAWAAEETAMQGFVTGLSADDLSRWVEYTTSSGRAQGSTLYRALTHVVIHGAQFRGEAGAVLGGLGHSPGDLDYLMYGRETDQR